MVTAGTSSIPSTTTSAVSACSIRPHWPVSVIVGPQWDVPDLRKMFVLLVIIIFSFYLMLDVFLASVFFGAGQQQF